jgi:hypothetical protein
MPAYNLISCAERLEVILFHNSPAQVLLDAVQSHHNASYVQHLTVESVPQLNDALVLNAMQQMVHVASNAVSLWLQLMIYVPKREEPAVSVVIQTQRLRAVNNVLCQEMSVAYL